MYKMLHSYKYLTLIIKFFIQGTKQEHFKKKKTNGAKILKCQFDILHI